MNVLFNYLKNRPKNDPLNIKIIQFENISSGSDIPPLFKISTNFVSVT